MQFSEKLRKLRTEKGLSQSELAEKIYVSRSAVAKWENGLGLPNDDSLALLAEFFGVSSDYLLSDPEIANVIINKNNTLSKQKVWIILLIALSCVLVIAAVVLIPFAVNNDDRPPIVPEMAEVISRELIFETERNISTEDIINYPDYLILWQERMQFAPTRTFTYGGASKSVLFPDVLLKTTYTDGSVELKKIGADDCSLYYYYPLIHLWMENGAVYGNLPDVKEGAGCANICYSDLRLSIKIVLEATPVEKVEITSDYGNEVKLTEDLNFRVNVYPSYASYRDYTVDIEKIVKPDGTEYDGDLTEYAKLDKNWDKLLTTENLEPESMIYLSAKAETDGVKSELFAVKVVRIPATLHFNCGKSSLKVGESCSFTIYASPQNCTYNLKGEKATVKLLTPDLATLEEMDKGYLLTANYDIAAIGKQIKVEASAPEGVTRTLSFTIMGINIDNESIGLYNADTGEKLENCELMRGDTLRVAVKIVPENATYTAINFSATSEFDYTQDGVFTVKPTASLGRANISAKITYISSGGTTMSITLYIDVTIVKRPVERIELSAENDFIEKGTISNFTFKYYPENADIISSNLKVSNLDNVEGVYVIDSSVFVTYYAAGGSTVRIQAVCDGADGIKVESNIITLTVKKVPVEEVALSIETDKVLKGELYSLSVEYNLGADVEKVEYKLLDEVEGVFITGDNIFIAPTATAGTVFRLQAIADGVESNILTIKVVDEKTANIRQELQALPTKKHGFK